MADGVWTARPMAGNKQYALVNGTGEDAFDVELSGPVEVGSSEEQRSCVSPGHAVEFHDFRNFSNSESPVVSWADYSGGKVRHEFQVSI